MGAGTDPAAVTIRPREKRGRGMYYIWITAMLAVLIGGMGALLAFGCRLPRNRL